MSADGQDINCQPDDVDATDLARLSETYWRADQWRHSAMADLQCAIRAAARTGTMSESEMARVSGLTRMTVRKALGK